LKITEHDVRRIEKLAHLQVDEAASGTLTRQLEKVLSYFEQLQELDTDEIEPTTHVVDLTNAFRADETRPSLPADEAVAGAPAREASHFKVPPVI
jgi:aspartyl-tRNA(Asn)/glutamyl-tRNA(Gln) amidotransferase subunit C